MSYGYPSRLAAQARCNGNQLLASLPTPTWLDIESELQQVDLPLGACLHETGSVPRHVYFPTTAIVSLVSEMRDGSSAEVAVVGAEGVVGVCTCMGSVCAHNTAVVQAAGRAWRMAVPSFVQQTWRSADLMRPVLRYGQALMLHVSQTSACNRHHGLEQRLCRWLLSMLDRQQSREVLVTQERIAAMLGVRREGVTTAAFKLQKEGLIRYARGHVQVLDREALEARSCECHMVIRAAYEELFDDIDATGTPWGLPQTCHPGLSGTARPHRAEVRPVFDGQDA